MYTYSIDSKAISFPARSLAAAVLAFSVSLCVPGSHAVAHAATHADTSSPASQGDKIFHQRCIVCHNKKPNDTTPFGPPNLFHVFDPGPAALTSSQAEEIITKGKSGGMPAFGSVLSKREIVSVIAYLKRASHASSHHAD